VSNTCLRTGVTRQCRVAAHPRAQSVSANSARKPFATFAVIRKLAARVAYLGFLIAVPGSLIILAAWHWREFRRRVPASVQ
jgi:hypothetical protein